MADETPEERSKRLTRERVQRHRAKDKPSTVRITVLLTADDAEAWREILTKNEIPTTMSVNGGTTSYIAEQVRQYRRRQAEEGWEEVLDNVEGDWKRGEGGVTTGWLQSQPPPEPGARLVPSGKNQPKKPDGWEWNPPRRDKGRSLTPSEKLAWVKNNPDALKRQRKAAPGPMSEDQKELADQLDHAEEMDRFWDNEAEGGEYIWDGESRRVKKTPDYDDT